ncbi:MAG: fasciclin domain-containing protein [Salinivirgaceae bacterium]
MKTVFKNLRIYRFTIQLALLVLLGFILSQCRKDPMVLPTDDSDMVMTDYVYNNPDEFSEFGLILELTGVENILRVRGPYTLFLPTNDAMKAFYAKNQKSSYKDFEIDFLRDLAYNHILK